MTHQTRSPGLAGARSVNKVGGNRSGSAGSTGMSGVLLSTGILRARILRSRCSERAENTNGQPESRPAGESNPCSVLRPCDVIPITLGVPTVKVRDHGVVVPSGGRDFRSL